MDTSNLKRFATQARSILKQGVINKFAMLGFDADGNVKPENEPVPVQGGVLFKGQVIDDPAFYPRWQSLRHRVSVRGIRDVYEEAAYTWFNRFMAISILQHNGLMAPALQFESDDVRIPLVVGNARRGLLPTMTDSDRTRLNAIINDDTQTTPQFAILVTALCQFTPILKACFGGITDYTALLLPDDILAKDGFIDLLNHTPFITDDDYRQSELIGWLYQFYISERKDEVFASFKNGHKAEAEDIPAATQIFTPNWIVKYMVQNTLGRIYLDNNPDSDLASNWQYLVDSPSERGQGGVLKLSSLEDYSFADLSCGSGHILVEAFDLLYSLYQQEFYSRRDAITAIFTHNLTGVDIDTRARQLASFALLLKACQLDNSFSNAQVLPNVLDMPEPYTATDLQAVVTDYLIDADTTTIMQVVDAVELMKQAYNLGSIMKFELSAESRAVIQSCTDQWLKQTNIPAEIQNMMHYMRILLALSDKYAAVVMNPPYMGSGNMNADLAKYVKDNYEDYKADLFAVFMKVAEDHLMPNAKYGMINMQSWMFITSFLKVRKHIIDDLQIDNMLHLGPRTFDEIGGEVVQNTAFVITNAEPSYSSYYFRLFDFAPSDVKKDNFINCCRHIRINGDISKMEINLSPYCFNVNQSNFKKIPGFPIGYWISERMISIIASATPIDNNYKCREGLHTTDNKKYVRLWPEVNSQLIAFDCNNYDEVDANGTWVPYNKGGGYRRWYGLNDYVVAFNKHYRDEMAAQPFHVRPSEDLYFKEGGTWSAISTGKFAIRYYPKGFIFDAGGQVAVGNNIIPLIAYLNSNLFDTIAKLTMPTINFKCGVVKTLPNLSLVSQENENALSLIKDIAEENVAISKADWDAHETSWDFKENELVRIFKGIRENPFSEASYDKDMPVTLETVVDAYEREWEQKFHQLHKNEEELNRQFIEIYGLQDELTPDVPLEEITILQQGEKTILNLSPTADYEVDENTDYGQKLLLEAGKDISINGIWWNKDNIIQQFISYAIGCCMGRYRLDRPGLHIAHPNPTVEELESYEVFGSSFTIDDDAIIPILSRDCGFPDNMLRRVTNFIELVFGPQTLVANLNFIEATLGKSLEDYLSKDFWKDHVKRYQKRPIYWLFSSKKGAFKAITYMHRMDAFTVSTIRNHYLLPYINTLETRIDALRVRQSELSAPERRTLERLVKDLDDCREYDLRLHQVADQQIAFDLDDGVLVNYAKFGDVLSKL